MFLWEISSSKDKNSDVPSAWQVWQVLESCSPWNNLVSLSFSGELLHTLLLDAMIKMQQVITDILIFHSGTKLIICIPNVLVLVFPFESPYPSNPGMYCTRPSTHALLPSHHELASVELVQQAGLSSTDQRQQWCLPRPPLNMSLWEQHNQPHVTTSCSIRTTLE